MASGLAYNGKPNINDLRLMFDSSRYAPAATAQSESNPKRNQNHSQQMHTSAILETSSSAKCSAFADAKPSSFDETVFDVARLPSSAGGATRNMDFDRVKQKFEKPTSLALNVKPTHTKPIVRLGQPNGSGGGGGCGGSSKRVSADLALMGVAAGATMAMMGDEEGLCGSAGSSSGFAMTTSMNLDELKVSDDDVSCSSGA